VSNDTQINYSILVKNSFGNDQPILTYLTHSVLCPLFSIELNLMTSGREQGVNVRDWCFAQLTSHFGRRFGIIFYRFVVTFDRPRVQS